MHHPSPFIDWAKAGASHLAEPGLLGREGLVQSHTSNCSRPVPAVPIDIASQLKTVKLPQDLLATLKTDTQIQYYYSYTLHSTILCSYNIDSKQVQNN